MIQHAIFKSAHLNSEILVVFVGLGFVFRDKLFQFCTTYKDIGFDQQAQLLWQFTAAKGLLPFRDIFYPYGILPYLRDHFSIFHAISFVSLSIICVIILLTLKNIWKDRLFTYTSFLVFLFFIVSYSQSDTLLRNGVIVAAGCMFAYFSCKYQTLHNSFIVILGIISGIIFFLTIDQGIYLIFLSSIFISLFDIFRHGIIFLKEKKYYVTTLRYFAFYIIGICIGSLPFVFFLSYNNSFIPLLSFLLQSSDLVMYAKTPFTPYANSPENIFIFMVLVASIIHVAFILGSRKRTELSLVTYTQLFLLLVLIILEQKSLIRSIDKGIVFIGFLLLFPLLSAVKTRLVGEKIRRLYIYLYFCLFFTTIIVLNPFQLYSVVPDEKSFLAGKSCTDYNMHGISKQDPTYLKVIDKLKSKTDFNGKIFSFPADPIFYILLDQNPPFYFNSYDASTTYAQKSQIQYIENKHVDYVIYNTEIKALQDQVPEYVRANTTLAYVMNNFGIDNTVGNFLILRRKQKLSDFFEEVLLGRFPVFKSHLLKVNLSSIPLSEGRYKSKNLGSDQLLLPSSSLEEVNNYLKKQKTSSSDLLLVFTQDNNLKKQTTVTFETNNNIKTEITFKSCNNGQTCIIHLSRVPLFFSDRMLKEIKIKEPYRGFISIYRTKSAVYW